VLHSISRIISIGIFMVLWAGTAMADAIDGDWCSSTGQHISIAGPQMTLADGVIIRGDYSRHGFSYAVPAGQKDAGQMVHLRQRSEEQMDMFRIIDGKADDGELWQRCEVVS
jgi:hypothetical protein